ncbi:hypothetical protein [Acinetobacter baumannii]|uniref:hypothetical protein n=1 Tax=Acinetobacter baumannii TaxID=470 RepID=UPI00321986A4
MSISNFFKIIFLVTSTFLTGCASLTLESKYPTNDYKTDYTILQKDIIIGLGETRSNDEQSSQTLLIGEQYNYLLKEGGHDLLNIMQKLPEQDRVISNKLPLQLEVYNDNVFYGQIQFYHPVPINQLSSKKQQELMALGFTEESLSIDGKGKDLFLSKNIPIEGSIYEGSHHTDPLQLRGTIPIILQERNLTIQENKSNILKKKLLSPLALVFDIITFPIQFGVGGLSKK